jgi:hypothetical protein
MKWNNIHTQKPKPYQLVKTKGKWFCDKVLYLDDDIDGWEQKTKGEILVTHWKPITKRK